MCRRAGRYECVTLMCVKCVYRCECVDVWICAGKVSNKRGRFAVQRRTGTTRAGVKNKGCAVDCAWWLVPLSIGTAVLRLPRVAHASTWPAARRHERARPSCALRARRLSLASPRARHNATFLFNPNPQTCSPDGPTQPRPFEPFIYRRRLQTAAIELELEARRSGQVVPVTGYPYLPKHNDRPSIQPLYYLSIDPIKSHIHELNSIVIHSGPDARRNAASFKCSVQRKPTQPLTCSRP